MIRTGFVKEKKGETLNVCFERPSSCEGCKGCAKGLMRKSELLTVYGDANVGDTVDVKMPENRVFQAALLAYALPLCGLIAFLMIGSLIGLSDTVSFFLALLGLAVGFGIGRVVEKVLSKNKNWRPEIIAVRPCTVCTAEERNTENE